MVKQCHRIPLKPTKKNENILELMAKKVRQNLKRYKIFTTGLNGYGEESGRPLEVREQRFWTFRGPVVR